MRHMYELRTISGSYVGLVFANKVVTDESRTKFIVAGGRVVTDESRTLFIVAGRTVLIIWNDRMTYKEVK